MAMTVLVAYDITVDKRRSRLAALLQGWGDRIQYSVFVVSIGEEQLAGLRADMERIIDEDEDSVFVVAQCKNCWESLVTLGQGEPPRTELFWGAF